MTFTWTPPTPEARRSMIGSARPRTSQGEFSRRRGAIAEAALAEGCDLVLVYGADRAGSGIPWLTDWPVTREAALLLDLRDGAAILWIQFHNHVPLAGELAHGCEVRWGGPSTVASLVDELRGRDGGNRLLGVIGPLRFGFHATIASEVAKAVDLSRVYTRLRLIKSDEELDLLAAGAHLSDLAAVALRDGIYPGIVDHELADLVERAYVPLGGTTHIHYFGLSSMTEPDRGAPAQVTTGRRLHPGDALVTELSAAFDGYSGQVLRTMTMDDVLSPLFTDLHEVANAAFAAVCRAIRPGGTPGQVVEAAEVIEDAGFTVVDDLVHGFGGGYLPPVLGSSSRPAGPLPDLTFQPGMTVVVQPNVTTTDHRAGVQTGELVVVTDDGVRSLHEAPAGPWLGVGTDRAQW